MSQEIKFSDLPKLGSPLHGGIFAGLVTRKDGTHCAVVLLPDQGTDLIQEKAMEWAKQLEAELPNRPVASLLYANVKDHLRPKWHWTSENYGAFCAWRCNFTHGNQLITYKSLGGSAVAIRLIPVEEA